MSKPNIEPEKIHSPIQLMAAWFVMLILLSGVLLTAASQIDRPDWAAGYLVIATTVLIVSVLSSVILMLTKYRPHLQEGREYAEWLRDQNRYTTGLIKEEKDSTRQVVKEQLQRMKAEALETDAASIIEKIEGNVLYQVQVVDAPGSTKVLSTISSLGIKASIYKSPYEEGDGEIDLLSHEAIWLGASIPTKTAVIIIKTAISIWPHLKYIHLSSDSHGPDSTHWQIFLGGSSSTAIERFQLKTWTAAEINELNEHDSMTEFHEKIRAKYL